MKTVYYVWHVCGNVWKGTTAENYNAFITNASQILTFSDFATFDEVKQYIAQYLSADLEVVRK